MKHTPGPWTVSGHKSLFIEPLGIHANHNEYGSSGNSIVGASQIYNNRTIKEAQANAALIAAAPDLLEACVYTIKQLKSVKGKTFPIMPILNAIYKATP